MTDYKKISEKIDSIKNFTEQYEYCKKIFAQIEKEEKKEYDLLMKRLPDGRCAYAVAIENGKIEYSEDMLSSRQVVWKKCNDIIFKYEFIRTVYG